MAEPLLPGLQRATLSLNDSIPQLDATGEVINLAKILPAWEVGRPRVEEYNRVNECNHLPMLADQRAKFVIFDFDVGEKLRYRRWSVSVESRNAVGVG